MPSHIDLEAIALTQGVRVRYAPLVGCEARIFGNRENAIVTVNSSSYETRQRFSLAHELGHWNHHRGKTLFCSARDISGAGGGTGVERVANNFAADLLMPGYLFDPIAVGAPISLASVDKLAEQFNVGRTAAAIRFVARNEMPSLLVKYDQNGRGWFIRSKLLPIEIWPRQELHPDSPAFRYLFAKGNPDRTMRKAPADHWIEGYQAKRHDLRYQAFLAPDGLLGLLHLDNRMVAEF